MSDHESETSQTGSEGAWEAISRFSENGVHAEDGALATDVLAGAELDDRTKFLADLARVMQSTAAAEQERNAQGTEQRLKSHIDRIRAREAIEAEELRELAKEDVKSIDAWSEGEIKRIKLERERRIASRREQLQIRLEEHRAVVAREVDAVERAVAGYRAEVDDFFIRLEAQNDPIAIAQQAGSRPAFPDLDAIGPDGVTQQVDDYGYVVTVSSEPAVVADDQGYEGLIGETIQEAEAEPVQQAEAEPVFEPEPVYEAAAVQEPEPIQAVEAQPVQEAEPVVATEIEQTYEAPVQEPVEDAALVGVMDPDAGTAPAESPWSAPVEADSTADEGASPVEAEAAPEGEAEGEPEPAMAEAHVVMPRSSGAGSWLRWPSNSIDRSDPDQ